MRDLILVLVVVAASVTDLRARRIPNRLTYAAACLGLGLGVVEGEAAFYVAGAALGLAPALLLYRRRGLGAGDAKLLGALGALGGPLVVVHTYFWSFVAAAALGLVLAARQRALLRTIGALVVAPFVGPLVPFRPSLAARCLPPPLGRLPMAPCIAVAVIVTLLKG